MMQEGTPTPPEDEMIQEGSDPRKKMKHRWDLEKRYERKLSELISLVNDLKLFKNMGRYQKSAEILDKVKEVLAEVHGLAEKLTSRTEQKEGVLVQVEVPAWVAESKGTKEVFKGEIKRETNEAYQIKVEGSEKIWLPKDRIRSLKRIKKKNN